MKRFGPLAGQKTTHQDIKESFEGRVLAKKVREIQELFQGDSKLLEPVLNIIADEIDSLLSTIAPIHDLDELQYLLAIVYTQLKSKWIQYNIKINYTIFEGEDPLEGDIFAANALTHVLDLLEPLTHPDAVRTVTMTLGQRLREIELIE